jgi:hypothetical protein
MHEVILAQKRADLVVDLLIGSSDMAVDRLVVAIDDAG